MRYTMQIHGNGLYYTMTDKATGLEKWAFGDDALLFEKEYESMSDAHANPASPWHEKPWNACLQYLFDDCLA